MVLCSHWDFTSSLCWSLPNLDLCPVIGTCHLWDTASESGMNVSVLSVFLCKLVCTKHCMCRAGPWCKSVYPADFLVWGTGPVLGGAYFVTSNSFPYSGGFLTSCEAELQELMKQIDIMVAHKKSEWEGQTQALEACLSAREQELNSARAALQEKCQEVPQVHMFLQSVSTCVFPVF